MPNGNSVGSAPATSTTDSFNWLTWQGRILRGLGIAYLASAAASFLESFHGLIDWFHRNNFPGFYGWIAPAMIDVVALFGETVLLLAIMNSWPRRVRYLSLIHI